MHWYSWRLFGRSPCEATQYLSKRASFADKSHSLNANLRWVLQTLKHYVTTAPPLTLRATSGRTLLVFTDGSYEPSNERPAGIGGIIYDDKGLPLRFFSDYIPSSILQSLGGDSEHPIYEVENICSYYGVPAVRLCCANSVAVQNVASARRQVARCQNTCDTPWPSD